MLRTSYISSLLVVLHIASPLALSALDVLTPPKAAFTCLTLTRTVSLTTKEDSGVKNDVWQLQTFLAIHGYLKAKPTGTFGKATESALKLYQQKEGIPITGVLDQKTREVIAKKNCKQGEASSLKSPTKSVTLKTGTAKEDVTTRVFSWTFRSKSYQITLPLSTSYNELYRTSPKVFTYRGKLPDNWTEQYNAQFLTVKQGDATFDSLTSGLLALAKKENFSTDETASFILSFVQSIPYDFGKDIKKEQTQYPYETLFSNKGVCADKTFLAYHLLKRAGYGVAIMQFLERNHQAVGIRCPVQDSLVSSGYCFGETTNSLPIGMIPTSFGSNGRGVSVSPEKENDPLFLFDPERLGRADIFLKTEGRAYEGVQALKQNVAKLSTVTKDVDAAKSYIETLSTKVTERKSELLAEKALVDSAAVGGNYAAYTEAAARYKSAVDAYTLAYDVYQGEVEKYNASVKEYNTLITIFDQVK